MEHASNKSWFGIIAFLVLLAVQEERIAFYVQEFSGRAIRGSAGEKKADMPSCVYDFIFGRTGDGSQERCVKNISGAS